MTLTDRIIWVLEHNGTEDLAVADLISSEDGVRTYLYTKFELVTIRGA